MKNTDCLPAAAAFALGTMALTLSLSAAEAQNAAYVLTRTVPLGAPDRWDYVVADGPAHRVYVAHGDRVTVVDAVTGQIIGEVGPIAGGTHGIAIASAAGRGYTDDGRAGSAVAFDLKTLHIDKVLKTDDDADALAFDSVSGHVYVVDGDPGKLSVIDPAHNSVIASASLGSKLEYAVAGGDGKLYVNSVEKHEIVRVDTATNQVDAHWPMPACERPHGLAIDTGAHLLFAGCVNSLLTVVNAGTGAVLVNVPIGRGSDAVVFDPKRKLIVSANGQDGTLSVIHEESATSFTSVATIKTAISARTLGIDPESGRLFLAAAEIDTTAPPATAAAEPNAQAARPGRPKLIPGSLKLLFMDPQP